MCVARAQKWIRGLGSLRRGFSWLAVLLAVLSGTWARADFVTYETLVELDSGESLELTLPGFDPSKGTLIGSSLLVSAEEKGPSDFMFSNPRYDPNLDPPRHVLGDIHLVRKLNFDFLDASGGSNGLNLFGQLIHFAITTQTEFMWYALPVDPWEERYLMPWIGPMTPIQLRLTSEEDLLAYNADVVSASYSGLRVRLKVTYEFTAVPEPGMAGRWIPVVGVLGAALVRRRRVS